LTLPDRKFNRQIGVFAGRRFDPGGRAVSEEVWQQRRDEWLPSAADNAYLKSLQATPVFEPGKFANYIAPPLRGINQRPIDFEYVRTES
jgi:benzoyl-CoA 2,3-epoxidase subunit B